ncbi:hypothetical protein PVK06_043137 [Gossypium arboreum]|uniref:Uncharacterized protein n=1 Tax=Gossypium arboreum TaxID=29729 RepID=A0ABR0MQ79_GOSAR|nr:hypothetical protein PVK06_043137 [Gossypium arboreum]
MVLRLDGIDVSGFKFLFSLPVMYGLMSILVHSVMYTKFIMPLGIEAPLDRFSEARAIEHGLRETAEYIKAQLERLKERAGSNFRIEIEENVVGGSFNMMFLGHGLSTSTFDVPMSPKKALHAAMLKRRFADNILKAQKKALLDHVNLFSCLCLPFQSYQDDAICAFLYDNKFETKFHKKAKIEAQILAAEAAAKMKAEVELKKQREREREAARIALQKLGEHGIRTRDLFFGGLTWLPLGYAYFLLVVSCLRRLTRLPSIPKNDAKFRTNGNHSS